MSSTRGELELKMPPDVGPRLAALSRWRETMDSAAQAYTCEVQQAANTVLGTAAEFDERWRHLCRQVLEGRLAEMQALRNQFLSAFTDRLRQLAEARDLVRFAVRVTQRDLPEEVQLEEEVETLQSKLKKLSSRWQTAEDLEDLAAESIAPSVEKLEAVRRKYGYPQAWYDDDSKPF
jgi:hypothetical protein